jgi:subtilase family serine protease
MYILNDIAKGVLLFTAALVLAGGLCIPSATAAERVIDDKDVVALPGNVHPLARPEFDAGPAPSSLPMERMILVLKRSADKQAELDRFAAALHDRSSPDFHRWLTPEEFGNRFGPSSDDVDAVAGWLKSHNFTVEGAAKSKGWIIFSGTAGDVKNAFHTTIHTYLVKGRLYHANAEEPSIPRALADVIAGIVSLNDFPRKPMHGVVRPAAQPDDTSGGAHYLSPGDFAVIYDVDPLYSAGINGAGQSIAIAGRTLPSTYSTDWATFRSTMGLPANPPQVVMPYGNPGDVDSGDDLESDLDVEWSGAVAPSATIIFVTSPSGAVTDGVDLSSQYIVDNNLAPVMSLSYGECEQDLGSAGNLFYNNLWHQAASQGMTVFVSSGDSGAAGCDADDERRATQGPAVNGLGSTPYNVAVGGTEFNEGSGSYWSSTNGSGDVSALSYIPEVVWNQSGDVSGGSDLYATGGGASVVWPSPSWQSAMGSFCGGSSWRSVPDVSLTGAGHDAYMVEMQGAITYVYGTSAPTPSFAGLMALVVQKTGQRQGNANMGFYQMASAQYGAAGPAVFHNITSGNNSVPGQTGYSAGTGYSCTTGLGSVDANALVANWPDFAVAASPSALFIDQGSAGACTVQTTVMGEFDSALTLTASGLPAGVAAAFSPATIPSPGAGSSTMMFTVASSASAGTYSIGVTGSSGGSTRIAAVSLTIVQVYAVTSSVSSGSGAITPASAEVPAGNPAVLAIYPGAGYYLATLTDNGVNVTADVVGNTYTIADVAEPHAVVAAFDADMFTISVGESGNGSITDSAGSVPYGGSVTFTMTPGAGYALTGLTDNGTGVNATPGPSGTLTYTITDVTGNQAVDATFSPASSTPVPAMGPWGFMGAACGMLMLAMRRAKKP